MVGAVLTAHHSDVGKVEEMLFDREGLISGLGELGSAAYAAGKVIDLCVYRGSCLMLVSDFGVASDDVDAVATTDQPFVHRIAEAIAERRGWPKDWLNDGVRTYLSPSADVPDDHLLTGTYPSERQPGIRVYVPTPEYMLAMKLMAMRIDEASGGKDKDDILDLIDVVGIGTKSALVEMAAAYYPEAKASAKLLLSADALVAESKARRKGRHAPPRYFGRSGGGREGRE